jgi:hypothetical protein
MRGDAEPVATRDELSRLVPSSSRSVDPVAVGVPSLSGLRLLYYFNAVTIGARSGTHFVRDTCPTMSQNLEIVREAFLATSSGDPAAGLPVRYGDRVGYVRRDRMDRETRISRA